MTLILDTSILIGIEKRDKKVLRILESLSKKHPSQAVIPFATYFEFMYGLELSSWNDTSKEEEFIEKFLMLSSAKRTAKILARIMADNSKKGNPLLLADAFIAAQSMESDFLLVTRDSIFSRIEGLKCIVV